MDPERWGRLRALFDATVEMSAEDRETLLERHRGADPQLVAKLRRMLAANDRPDALIDHSPVASRRRNLRARPH